MSDTDTDMDTLLPELAPDIAAEPDFLNEDYIGPGEQRLPYGFARRHGVLINQASDNQTHVIYKPGVGIEILAEVRRYIGCKVKMEEVNETRFEEMLLEQYESASTQSTQIMENIGDDLDLNHVAMELAEPEDLLENEDDAPIIRLINALFTEAIKENASDIHIEPYETRMIVRFRVDGMLREVLQPPRIVAPLLVSRIKVMADLDIAEKRLPQDGRIALRIAGRAVDVRVSTLPSIYGERIVLRILDKQAGRLDLEQLGMDKDTLRSIDPNLIMHPHGIILVTGPTGSGKTTTLYAVLSRLNDKTRNIVTIEDPIEYHIDGIGQTQVNTKVELTFARGLRAILRQDPDIVMIGEIRDLETAQIAVQSSLTGHLVLSTLHTNTAISSVTRLRDMGIEPYLLASSLIGVVAQRLVRLLCDNCKEAYTASANECALLGVPPENPPTLYAAVGCEQCKQQGYTGRSGIYELVLIDDTMRSLIHDNASEQEMHNHARTITPGIRQDGIRRVLEGQTTLDEVIRVTQED